MKRVLFLLLFLAAAPLRADELAFYWLNNLAVQYEGTGYRPGPPAGWELKVKPQGSGEGLRWRHGSFQLQYWRNNPYFSWEDGNSASSTLRQTGQTRYGYETAVADIRFPLAGTALEAVGGLQAARVVFERKSIVFHEIREPASAGERMEALGPVLGFHGRAEKQLNGLWGLWTDGEVLAGHFFWTDDRQKTDGGAGNLHRGGYSYLFRAEAGLRRGPLRVGLGLVRQAAEIIVPGGKSLPGGAAASLPINQNDFQSPFISISWIGL